MTKDCICGRGGAAENKAFPLSFVDFDAEKLCDGAIDGVLTQSWPPLVCKNVVIIWNLSSESLKLLVEIFEFVLVPALFQGLYFE